MVAKLLCHRYTISVDQFSENELEIEFVEELKFVYDESSFVIFIVLEVVLSQLFKEIIINFLSKFKFSHVVINQICPHTWKLLNGKLLMLSC